MADEAMIALTANIVSAHVSHNNVGADELGDVIAQVHAALTSLGKPVEIDAPARKPAVSVKASVKPDYIVCLICGASQKMLKRHLQTHHGLSAADYKAEFNLPASYPLTATNYAKMRSALAQASGLGKRPNTAPDAAVPVEKPPARKRLKIKTPA